MSVGPVVVMGVRVFDKSAGLSSETGVKDSSLTGLAPNANVSMPVNNRVRIDPEVILINKAPFS
jgi:hypothetical protein